MRYQGGKGLMSRHLSPVVLEIAAGRAIAEPFCGGLSMTAALQPRVASDACRPLIELFWAVRSGWMPPEKVSEDDYRRAKRERGHGVTDPWVTYVGFCASFGGKWFGGYARGHKRQRFPVLAARNALLERVRMTAAVEIVHQTYDQCDPCPVIYCDPPYRGTTCDYPDVGKFNHERFWNQASNWASRGSTVLVSEFSAPAGVRCVWEMKYPQQTRSRNPWKTERLFHL